jgi:DNA helicase-2/ATP-dependent DNA helicase PcrA
MRASTLTTEQSAIVDAGLDGPHLVNAGAGTGKTFTLVERAVALVHERGLSPEQILLITFTKAAAAEIATRIDAAFGTALVGRPTSGTFHSVAATLLREFAYEVGLSPDARVIDDARARGVFRRAIDDLRAGRLDVDLSAFPLLERPDTLESSLAKVALQLKQAGQSIDDFEAMALARAAELETIGFGAVFELGKRDKKPLDSSLRPNPPRTPEERYAEAARERLNVHVAAALFRRFDELLDAEALLTYGDALHRTIAMIEANPTIAERLRTRWHHVIVDEFQDTNPTQIAFLKAIFGDDLRPVLAVGDVRQAIFGFQGADPHGIIELGRQAGCTTFDLTENRRSFQPILDVAHHALSEFGGVPAELHRPLVAHRGTADGLQIHHQIFDGPDGLEREAAAVAGSVRDLVDRGTPARCCALLLRSRTRADVYADALRAQGLAVRLTGGIGFFDAPEIREAVAWLRVVDRPHDDGAIVAALQSASIALGDGAVAYLARSGSAARAALVDPIPEVFDTAERARLERFREIAAIACGLADVNLVSAVRTIIAAAGIELARIADPAALDQASANLEKLLRLAAELSQDRPLARVRDLVMEIDTRREHDADLPPAELEGDRVTISTIHGAKGLEWHHVFLVNCSASTFPANNRGDDTVARFDAQTGAFALKHEIGGRITLRWYLSTTEHDGTGMLVPKNDDGRMDEEFRLLYVALTRARDVVYVTGRKVRGNDSKCAVAVQKWLESSGLDPMSHHLPVSVTADQRERLAQPLPTAEAEMRVLERLTRVTVTAHVAPTRRGALSYSAMELHERCPRRARYHYVLGLPDLTDDAGAFKDSIDVGDGEPREARDPARYGRIVHKVLELDAKARIAGAERDLDRFVADAIEEESGTPGEAEAAKAAAIDARPFLDRYTPIAVEHRFDIGIADVQLGGYIDLLARDDAGRPVVVDYKTGRTPSEHYALQFALYRRAGIVELNEIPRTVLLRINPGDVHEDDITPATDAELEAAVIAAKSMESDEARPGIGCRSCPYAHDICRDAPAVTNDGGVL